MPRRYRIYLLSAQSILSYAKEEGGAVSIALNRDATRRCQLPGRQEQEENALFFQIQCTLHGDGFIPTEEPGVVEDLSAVLCYVDFSGIFDRNPASPRVARLQALAEALFRPEGVTMDLGDGPRQYAAFERSNSMSRQGRLSFLRADLWEPVRRRIMLDLELGQCQLSKLYAYNGLMLSTGTRVEGMEIDRPHRVIVVDNHALQRSARVITVEDVGGTDSVRRYRRVERVEDFSVTEFDGEGLISKEYAARLNKALGGRHTSFQVRLPFVKGMLHQVDFHDFFRSAGTTHLTDLWGVNHPVAKVDVILTKSMFKGYGWLTENGKSWEDYWAAFRKYRHALYVTNVSKERPQGFTQLNYQFLTTLSMTGEEFRPRDLPDGWEHSPKEDARQWLTKATETEYYKLRADAAYRRQVFTRQAGWWGTDRKSRAYLLGKLLEKNPAFIGESVYQEQLDAMAQRLLKDYALGRLQVAGDVRFLSGDLLQFLVTLLDVTPKKRTKSQWTFLSVAQSIEFQDHAFYAPRPGYKGKSACTLLRNPHIARNEEILLDPYRPVEQMRKHYLGHLTDVVMVSSTMYAAERLGGADFDGDMVKTIADPIVNRCVQKNYQYQNLDNLGNLPFLKIPSIQARVQDAKDWRAASRRCGTLSPPVWGRSPTPPWPERHRLIDIRIGRGAPAGPGRGGNAGHSHRLGNRLRQKRRETRPVPLPEQVPQGEEPVPHLQVFDERTGRKEKAGRLFILHRLGAGGFQPGAAALPGLAAGGAHSQAAGTLPARRGAVQLCPRPPVEREAASGLPQAGGGNDPGVPAVPGPHPGQHGPCPGTAPPHGRGAHPVRPGPGGAGDGGGAVRRLLRPGAGTGDRPAGTNPGTGVAVPASWGAGGLPPGTPTHRLGG